jgi:hypothetical protein
MAHLTSTAEMMDHVLASRSGVNSKFKVGREASPRVSRVKTKQPTLVIALPGGTINGKGMERGVHGTKTARAKVVNFVQWYDPYHRARHRIDTRGRKVTGITGKLAYQGVDAKGNAIWS